MWQVGRSECMEGGLCVWECGWMCGCVGVSVSGISAVGLDVWGCRLACMHEWAVFLCPSLNCLPQESHYENLAVTGQGSQHAGVFRSHKRKIYIVLLPCTKHCFALHTLLHLVSAFWKRVLSAIWLQIQTANFY